MVERSLVPPAALSPEELDALEPTAREAVLKAQADFEILYNKTLAAARYVREVKASAQAESSEGGGEPELAERESASARPTSSGPDGGTSSEDVDEASASACKNGEPVLPKLPCGERSPVKVVIKSSITRITEILQNANISSQTPERLVCLWDEMSRVIRSAGLSAPEVMAAVGSVTGEAAVSLCIAREFDNLDAWGAQLSRRYLQHANASDVTRRLFESQRKEAENSVQFLLRVAPLVRAAMLLQLVDARLAFGAVWSVTALGKEYCQRNMHIYDAIDMAIKTKQLTSVDALLEAVQQRSDLEDVPKAAKPPAPVAPAVTRLPRKSCTHCKRTGHSEEGCWDKHPELRPRRRAASNRETGNEGIAPYPPASDVFVVRARFNDSVSVQLGLDSMAAVNLIRSDAVPAGVNMEAEGPQLHGVGHVQAKGMVRLTLAVGGLRVEGLPFAVVDSLPVPALLGKPTLTDMRATIDMAADRAHLGEEVQRVSIRAVALPTVQKDSGRPQAQSYWNWINRRLAAAPKKLQTVVQDVLERADD